MTSTRTSGAVPPASAATMLRFAGNCTTAISVTALDAVHIELELRLLPHRLPREGAMPIFCRVQPMPVIVRFLPVLQ